MSDVCPTDLTFDLCDPLLFRDHGSALIQAQSFTGACFSVLVCDGWLAELNICFVAVEGNVTSWLILGSDL